MAFRRFTRSRSSASPRYRFRFRRGSSLRRPQEPFRWEVGQFVFEQEVFLTNGGTGGEPPPQLNDLLITVLAQIDDRVGDSGTSQGRALNNFARFLEIGGIVMHGHMHVRTNFWPDGKGNDNLIGCRLLVVSDRLDSAGNPASFPNWFTSTTPTTLAVATQDQDQDIDYPTRIHWQTSRHFQLAAANDDEVQTTAGLALQPVTNASYSVNRRLRLRLDDRTGLFLHFAANTVFPSTEGDPEWSVTMTNIVHGTMYYRVRFG